MFSVVSVCNSVCSPERALYRALALPAPCRAQPETQPPLYRAKALYRSAKPGPPCKCSNIFKLDLTVEAPLPLNVFTCNQYCWQMGGRHSAEMPSCYNQYTKSLDPNNTIHRAERFPWCRFLIHSLWYFWWPTGIISVERVNHLCFVNTSFCRQISADNAWKSLNLYLHFIFIWNIFPALLMN